MPKFSCTFTEDIVDPDEVCTAENICADDPRIKDSWIDWDSRNSLHNWYESLDLKCADSWQVSGISFANFIGCLITLPWAPKLGDVLGRKKILTWFNLVQFLSFTVIMFNKNLWVMTAASGVFGATNSIVASNGFLYMLELVPQKSKTRVATIFFMLDQTTYLLTTVYFWVISKHWFWIVFVGYIMQIIGVILYWFLLESPAFLLSLNRSDETMEVF